MAKNNLLSKIGSAAIVGASLALANYSEAQPIIEGRVTQQITTTREVYVPVRTYSFQKVYDKVWVESAQPAPFIDQWGRQTYLRRKEEVIKERLIKVEEVRYEKRLIQTVDNQTYVPARPGCNIGEKIWNGFLKFDDCLAEKIYGPKVVPIQPVVPFVPGAPYSGPACPPLGPQPVYPIQPTPEPRIVVPVQPPVETVVPPVPVPGLVPVPAPGLVPAPEYQAPPLQPMPVPEKAKPGTVVPVPINPPKPGEFIQPKYDPRYVKLKAPESN